MIKLVEGSEYKYTMNDYSYVADGREFDTDKDAMEYLDSKEDEEPTPEVRLYRVDYISGDAYGGDKSFVKYIKATSSDEAVRKCKAQTSDFRDLINVKYVNLEEGYLDVENGQVYEYDDSDATYAIRRNHSDEELIDLYLMNTDMTEEDLSKLLNEYDEDDILNDITDYLISLRLFDEELIDYFREEIDDMIYDSKLNDYEKVGMKPSDFQ